MEDEGTDTEWLDQCDGIADRFADEPESEPGNTSELAS